MVTGILIGLVGWGCLNGTTPLLKAAEVGKWKRHVVSLSNGSYDGNPFELEVDATFTHSASGSRLTLPGYYAGNDTWEIGFMPNRVGAWEYETSSSDPELDAQTGSLTCVDSGLPGMLKADPEHPRKWKFTDGAFALPIALRMEFFSEPASMSDFVAAADFMEANHFHLMETRLTEEYGQFGGRTDFVFDGDWRDHRFDLQIWERMEQRMEVLAERGLGAHIMFYSDDRGAPDWEGQSETEALVIRYTVARLCGYPVVWFNTGIDISEYRSQSDINWLGSRVRALDPYGHPISSRHGGGSGNSVMSGQTFDSNSSQRAEIDTLIGNFQNSSVPVSKDDAWGENRGSHPAKDHRPEDIRRAFWKCTIAGGIGALIRGGGDGGSENGFYYIRAVERDLESEQWLRLINPFIRQHLGETFGEMVPEDSLVSNGYCLADPDRTRLMYFLMGENDKWDSGNGGDLTLRLGGINGREYQAFWFDPRTGNQQELGRLQSGQNLTLTPPNRDDWILLLSTDNQIEPDSTPPTKPGDLQGETTSENVIQLAWNPASDPESGITEYRIYRDGEPVGTTPTTQFSESGPILATTFEYSVSAINGEGLEGPQSDPIEVTTLADETGPKLAGARLTGLDQIKVTFNEPVAVSTAEQLTHYQFEPVLDLTGVDLGSDPTQVSLSTETLTPGNTYTLAVNGIEDLSGNEIAPGTAVEIVVPLDLTLTGTEPAGYEWGKLAEGELIYVDRNYAFLSVPPKYEGLDYLRTVNDDKATTGENLIAFEVSQPVTVYVAHDDRISPKPGWLEGFTDTGDDLTIADLPFSLWKAEFPAGTVNLGGNVLDDSGDIAMYSVVVAPGSGGDGEIDPELQAPETFSAKTATATAVEGIKTVGLDAQEITLIFKVDHGMLALADGVESGLTEVEITGNGSGIVEVTAAADALNATLNSVEGLRYTSDLNFVGTDELQLTAQVLGESTELNRAISITVAGDQYANWLNEHFDGEQLQDPDLESDVWGVDADPDKDLMPNAVENVMGLNPMTAEEPPITLDVAEEGAERFMRLIFPRRKGLSTASIVVEFSTDLRSWTSQGLEKQVIEETDAKETIEVRVPIGSNPGYLRLGAKL